MGLLDPPAISRTVGDRRYRRRTSGRLSFIDAMPAVHASPPTIGSPVDITADQSTTTGTAITNAVRINAFGISGAPPVVDAYWTWCGWSPAATEVAGHFYARPKTPNLPNGSGRSSAAPGAVEFDYTGEEFEIRMYANSGACHYKLWVDGQPATATGESIDGVEVGHVYLIPVTFASPARRHIRLELNQEAGFGGAHVGPTDTVQGRRGVAKPQMLILGDSYSDGVSPYTQFETYAHLLGHLIGADAWVDGIGGTGLVSTGGISTKGPYVDRITTDDADTRLDPDVVLVQGSVNDSQGTATVQAAAATALSTIRDQWPNAYVITTGILRPRQASSLVNTDAQCNTAMLNASAGGAADLFINPPADLWYSGTGRVGATTGVGNVDTLMSSDSVHPTAEGQMLIAQSLQRYIAAVLGIL